MRARMARESPTDALRGKKATSALARAGCACQARRTMRRLGLVGALVLVACGATPPPRSTTPPPADDAASPIPPTPPGARHLSPRATFADLVRAVGEQDRLRDSDSDAGCLLRRRGDAFDVSADLAVAIRPLPPVEADLDARMEATPGPVRVLTRYGSYGSAPVGATALTTTAPAPMEAIATLLVMTDRGVYVRSSGHAARTVAALVPTAALAEIDEGSAVFVTAEAAVPVDDLARLLARLPRTLDGSIGLAALLPAETQLPAPAPAEASADVPTCEGLPPLGEGDVEGTLPTDRIVAGLAPLRATAEICIGTSSGPGARGGRVVLDLRIGAGGGVVASCVREDPTGDAVLRACLLDATRSLGFDDPHGTLDVELPLVLTPGLAHRQRALCDE